MNIGNQLFQLHFQIVSGLEHFFMRIRRLLNESSLKQREIAKI